MTSIRKERSCPTARPCCPCTLSRSATPMALLLTLSIFLALTQSVAYAESQIRLRDNILVLHSYSQDFVWTRSQQEGIDAVFKPLADVYNLRIEYLDALHYPELLNDPLTLALLRAKFANQRFRVVLTSDNAAFDFVRAHRDELFPGVPIVFMGVNGYEDSMLRGEDGITGVAEDSDLSGTLRVLLQLLPQTKRIIFPGMSDDITYRAIRSTVAKDLTVLPPQVAVEFPEYPNVDAALKALRMLPPDSAIVVMTNMRTLNGEGISSQRVVELVSAATVVPVFTNWDFVVGHGAVGGSVISGVEEGRLAAEIAVRILHGERPASIPVHRGTGKTFLFDYRQLARFGIPVSRLPPGAVVLFSPDRTLQISQDIAWIAGVSFVVLLGMTISLILSVMWRRRSEAQVRTLNQELEMRVRERTIELEATNKELEEFSYSISHNLSAPLRALDGFSAILLEEHGADLNDEGRRLLTVLRNSARRQGRMVDDFLRFLALGRKRINHSVIDIARLASEIFAELQADAPARRLRLEIGALPQAWGDPSLIRLVMQNLLSNAIKHSPADREALIEIHGVAAEHENVYSVTDHGIGIDMRYAKKLFRVFEHVHATNQYEGSGIGLAIAKRIIDRHGGRVWVESMMDEGATFYFALPHGKT
jgi:signal transduction histidine kinase